MNDVSRKRLYWAGAALASGLAVDFMLTDTDASIVQRFGGTVMFGSLFALIGWFISRFVSNIIEGYRGAPEPSGRSKVEPHPRAEPRGLSRQATIEAAIKWVRHSATEWWARQPESRSAATCDACGGREVRRNDGYLIGSSLWCSECYRSKGVEAQIRSDPTGALGAGEVLRAIEYFGDRS